MGGEVSEETSFDVLDDHGRRGVVMSQGRVRRPRLQLGDGECSRLASAGRVQVGRGGVGERSARHGRSSAGDQSDPIRGVRPFRMSTAAWGCERESPQTPVALFIGDNGRWMGIGMSSGQFHL